MKRIISQSLFLVALCAAPSAIRAEDQTREFFKNGLLFTGAGSLLYGLFNAEHLVEETRTYFEHRSQANEAVRQMNELRNVQQIARECNNVDEFKERADLSEPAAFLATAANWAGWFWSRITPDDTWDTAREMILSSLETKIQALNSVRKQALKRARLSTEIKLTCAGLLAGIVGLVMASK